jgi:hypothetical protein
MSRIYLSRRDLRTPEHAQNAAVEAITDWQDTLVRNALGQKYHASARVLLRRPWWMPGPLYQALLRSIVVEHQAERKK